MKSTTITLDNATGGIQKGFNIINGVKTSLPGAYSSGVINISKPGYEGQMSAPPSFTTVQTGMNGYPIGGVRVSNGSCYFLTDQARIYKLTTGDVLSLIGDMANGAGGDATFGDIWVNIDGVSGIEYVYCSYRTTGGMFEVRRFTPSTDTIAASALFSNATDFTAKHRALVMTRYFHVLNGQYVDRFDNNTDTYTTQAFTVAKGFKMTGICQYSNKYVAIVGSNGSTCRLWIWDQESTDADFTYTINDYNATLVINDSGELKIFTHGKNGTTKIFKFSGGEVPEEPIWEQATSVIGNSPEQYSVGLFYNQVYWQTPNLTGNTAIYSHGSPNKSQYYQGAHKALTLGSYSATVGGGMCENVKDNRLYIGFNQAGGGTLAYTDLTSFDNVNIGNYTSKLIETPRNSTISRIKIYVSNWQTGSYLSPTIYKTNSATEQLGLPGPAVQYADKNDLEYFPVKCAISDVNAFYFSLAFAKCTIRKIEITYNYEENDL